MRSRVSRVLIIVLAQLLKPVTISLCAGEPDTLDVPLLRAPGYGPFTSVVRLSIPGETAGPWARAVAEVRGVPVDLHGFTLRYMNMQMDQYVFQSYREGRIDPAFALDLIARNKYDTTKLTTKHVDQDIPIVAGYDGDGNTVYVIDTKDDHSFWGKDRIVIPPFRADALTRAQMDSLNDLIERPDAAFEFYDGKKVREGEVAVRLCPYVKVPASLAWDVRGKIVFGVGTYEYRRGVFKSGGRRFMAAVSNGFQSGVYGRGDVECAFFPSEDSSTVTPGTTLRYRIGDRVEIADEVFRIESVALDGSLLRLRRERRSLTGEGTAVGMIARDFQGLTLTGGQVSLRQFRGKHVLLYFWYPGSPLCAAGIPYLNDIHAAYGESGITVVGMALQEGPALAPFADEHLMGWIQVPLRDTSRVLRDYAVGGYPSVYLIDPQGRILLNGRTEGGDLNRSVASALGDSSSLVSLISKGNVVFRFGDEKKTRVEVAGDFTGWLPLPLYRGPDGFYRHVGIPPGRYHYSFIVDGLWTLDPSNDTTEDSATGRPSNMLVVK